MRKAYQTSVFKVGLQQPYSSNTTATTSPMKKVRLKKTQSDIGGMMAFAEQAVRNRGGERNNKGDNEGVQDHRYMAARKSTQKFPTESKARRILRHYATSTSITSNALSSYSKALQQKQSSSSQDLALDIKKFKNIVRAEQEKQRNRELFQTVQDKYQSQVHNFHSSQENSLKMKSDTVIEQRVKRELSAKQKIEAEQKQFKKEEKKRRYLELQNANAQTQKMSRVQSAKLLNDSKRLEVKQRAIHTEQTYLSWLASQHSQKVQKQREISKKSEQERQAWTLQHQQSLMHRQGSAQKRFQQQEYERYSPEKQQQQLIMLYGDIGAKEQRQQAQIQSEIIRLKSSNLKREEKAQKAWEQHLEDLKAKETQLLSKEHRSSRYLDQLTRVQSAQIRRKTDILRVKRDVANDNQNIRERKIKFETQQLQSKIEDHSEAHTVLESEKQKIEREKLKHHFDLEIRKAEIRETLYRMQVWNCWDQSVLDKVFTRPTGMSIDTVVRQHAAALERQRGSGRVTPLPIFN